MAVCPLCGQGNPEGARFCNACGSALEVQTAERRKLATLLFCDISGSTALGEALDAESVRELMFRYFHEMRSAIERHGGTVEKFVGDEVMAVFGVPQAHEDDALRAVRAAAEMRERLEELNPELERSFGTTLALHMGVNTGEVVAGEATREAIVTGDAVNVAARLYQAARAGEILLGELTHRLTVGEISAEPIEPIRAKGKSEAVPAYRLLSAAHTAPRPRATEPPLVGRTAELASLDRLFEQAAAERRCLVATIVGEPGLGKSRLARELSSRVAPRARVLGGRCLAYGEGITYWPIAEIVRSAAGIRDDDSPTSARTKVESLGEPAVTRLIASLAGLSMHPVAPGEGAWAVRRFLQTLTVERPLLLIVEDLHWAEPGLLDLLAELEGTEAAVLLLLTARPDLLEARPEWPVALQLEPLVEGQARLLVASPLLDAEHEEAVLRAAGGNPLFLGELAAFLQEEPEPTAIPPTLNALLSARLDRLPEHERQTAEYGSVEGDLFHRGAASHLAARDVSRELQALETRELINAARSEFAGEAAFRFKHVLVRDAAYNGTTKKLRAELHERLADWLEAKLGDRVTEAEEIVGYHLEQAYRYRVELRPGDEHAGEVSARAAAHIGSAGRRAFRRNDISAAVGLLRRASLLLAPGEPERLELLPELGSALSEAGRFEEAKSVLAEARREARQAGDLAAEGKARLEHLFMGLSAESVGWTDRAESAVRELLPVFESLRDHQALARLWRLSGMVAGMRSRHAELESAMEHALEHAREAGDEREVGLALFWIPQGIAWGPTPAAEGVRRCEALLGEARGSISAGAGVTNALAMLYAMLGRGEEARAALLESCGMYRELGLDVLLGAASMHAGPIELFLGDPAAAERGLRQALAMFEELGERGYRSTAEAWLAQALNEQGRHEEAEEATRVSEELAPPDDTPSQITWRNQRARAMARRGEFETAERLAREAVSLAEPTDTLDEIGESAFALAEVMQLAGRAQDAMPAAAEAVDAWRRKGIVGYVRRAEELFGQLEAAG